MHEKCPQCASEAFKKNGYTRHGKQNHRCLECGRQFSFEKEDSELEYTPKLEDRKIKILT